MLECPMMSEGFTGGVRNVISFTPTGFQIEVFRLGDDPLAAWRDAVIPGCHTSGGS